MPNRRRTVTAIDGYTTSDAYFALRDMASITRSNVHDMALALANLSDEGTDRHDFFQSLAMMDEIPDPHLDRRAFTVNREAALQGVQAAGVESNLALLAACCGSDATTVGEVLADDDLVAMRLLGDISEGAYHGGMDQITDDHAIVYEVRTYRDGYGPPDTHHTDWRATPNPLVYRRYLGFAPSPQEAIHMAERDEGHPLMIEFKGRLYHDGEEIKLPWAHEAAHLLGTVPELERQKALRLVHKMDLMAAGTGGSEAGDIQADVAAISLHILDEMDDQVPKVRALSVRRAFEAVMAADMLHNPEHAPVIDQAITAMQETVREREGVHVPDAERTTNQDRGFGR